MTLSHHVARSRFGLGVAPGDSAARGDAAAWLWRQTESRPAPPDPRPLQAAATAFAEAASVREKSARQAALKALFQRLREETRREFDRAFAASALSERPFEERLVWFWRNHFTVSAKGKPRALPFVRSYTADVIRPHVFGRFGDMLVAATRHPAMLIYLDNAQSVGPASPAGRRRGRGLNENLAREILELHTVGVDGGYTQRDVTELARLITGWTVPVGRAAGAAPGPFAFLAARHDPGPKTVMGRRYGDGLAEGERALWDLALKPETARFLAAKLCRHFIADDPPARAVQHVASRYGQTGGDLRETARALIEAASDGGLGAKFRAPIDHIAAAVRLLGPEAAIQGQALRSLIALGQAPFMAGSPAGYPDRTEDWATPDGIARRIEWSARLARRIGGVDDPLALADAAFGDALGRRARAAIAGAESAEQGLALLLTTPAFMWR